MRVVAVPSLSVVPAAAWDALIGQDNPFVEHAFLHGLELTACVGPGTGWQPLHLLVIEGPVQGDEVLPTGAELLGAAPLYVKTDSLGEFIFDFGWAHFYHSHGVSYYPKLVAAVPFTPVTGPRLLVRPGADVLQIQGMLADSARALAGQLDASSVHWLFLPDAEAQALEVHGYFRRLTTQALWLNPGYADFDAFLATRRHDARKQIRRERRDAQKLALEFKVLRGTEMGDAEWQAVRTFYVTNVDRHAGETYLNEAFFAYAREHLAARVVVSLARGPQGYVAGTLNFHKGRHLYGRYWGCTEDHAFLHFELGYYQLMDYCIAHGLTRFEAGAGGEHKLRRGMEMSPIHSAHWLADPRLGPSVRAHVEQEREATREDLADRALHGTARRDA
jgi:predicted N-acyltransferase